MRKRATAWACHPGELSGQLGDSALDQTASFLSDDPVGVAALWETIGQLADEPRPPESFPYGSPDLRRLRAGRYRVFYTIDEKRQVVQIDHVARLPKPWQIKSRPAVTFCSRQPVIVRSHVDRFVDRATCANGAIRATGGETPWYPCR